MGYGMASQEKGPQESTLASSHTWAQAKEPPNLISIKAKATWKKDCTQETGTVISLQPQLILSLHKPLKVRQAGIRDWARTKFCPFDLSVVGSSARHFSVWMGGHAHLGCNINISDLNLPGSSLIKSRPNSSGDGALCWKFFVSHHWGQRCTRQHVLEICNLNAAPTLNLALRDHNENAPPLHTHPGDL